MDVPCNGPYVYFDRQCGTQCENADCFDKRLARELLSSVDESGKVVALVGPTGVGKTCILKEVASNTLTRRRFCDGVAYLGFEQEDSRETVISKLSDMVKRFGGRQCAGYLKHSNDVVDFFEKVLAWFRDRSVLFLVDNLWESIAFSDEVATSLRALTSPSCSVVFTTRDSTLCGFADKIVPVKAREVHGHVAREILLRSSHFRESEIVGKDNETAFETVLERCAGMPHLLVRAGQEICTLSQELDEQFGNRKGLAWSLYSCQ